MDLLCPDSITTALTLANEFFSSLSKWYHRTGCSVIHKFGVRLLAVHVTLLLRSKWEYSCPYLVTKLPFSSLDFHLAIQLWNTTQKVQILHIPASKSCLLNCKFLVKTTLIKNDMCMKHNRWVRFVIFSNYNLNWTKEETT